MFYARNSESHFAVIPFSPKRKEIFLNIFQERFDSKLLNVIMKEFVLGNSNKKPDQKFAEEMCARLSALPIGYHTTATVAALESALHSSLTLMDAD